MKNLIYLLAFCLVTGVYAQEKKPVDKVEKTKTKTIKVNKNGKVIENKVKVTTSKEQAVMTTPNDSSNINNSRVYPKVKVTKTIQIDNDYDPFYESENKIVYYTDEDGKYAFTQSKNGFEMRTAENESFGYAVKSANNMFYILDVENYSGVGYFNNEGNFVVEYYNSELDMLIEKEFKTDTEF